MSYKCTSENYPHYSDPPSPVLPELIPAAAVPASLSSAGSSKLIEMATVNSLKGKTDFLLGNSKPQKRIEVGSEDDVIMRKMEERKLGAKEKEKDEFEIMIETLKLMNEKVKLALTLSRRRITYVRRSPLWPSPPLPKSRLHLL